jgi:hypothetical protein
MVGYNGLKDGFHYQEDRLQRGKDLRKNQPTNHFFLSFFSLE